METDKVEIWGLENLLDDDESVPYVELAVRCQGRAFRLRILRAEEEWALHVQEEGGLSIPGDGELFSTRAEAVLAGALRALSGGQRNPLT